MKKPLKIAAIIVGAISVLVIVVITAAHITTDARLSKVYTLPDESLVISNDSASVARGHHLAMSRGCIQCHGDNMAGQVFSSSSASTIIPSNLTKGKGGLPANYSIADYIRAIRHGVGADGLPKVQMPVDEYNGWSGADVADVISYIESLPPINNVLEKSSMTTLGRVLMMFGKLQVVHAELVDHSKTVSDAPAYGPTVEYGRYLIPTCTGCHGVTLEGQMSPWPPSKNISPRMGGLEGYDEAGFITLMRTGITPIGKALNPIYMPWKSYRNMSEVELRAIWVYLEHGPELVESHK